MCGSAGSSGLRALWACGYGPGPGPYAKARKGPEGPKGPKTKTKAKTKTIVGEVTCVGGLRTPCAGSPAFVFAFVFVFGFFCENLDENLGEYLGENLDENLGENLDRKNKRTYVPMNLRTLNFDAES